MDESEKSKAWRKSEHGKTLRRANALRYYYKHRERILARQKLEHQQARVKGIYTNGFGVSKDEVERRLMAQGGVCAICRGPEEQARGFALDHDHQYQKKDRHGHRGVLCHRCNLMLGQARDNPIVLQAAIEYLRKWACAQRRQELVGDFAPPE